MLATEPSESLLGEDALLWAFIAAGGTGLLLGLWFKVPALIAVSGLAAAIFIPIALTHYAPWSALFMTVALLGVLQFGYLAGLMLALAWSRTGLDHQRRLSGRRGGVDTNTAPTDADHISSEWR